MSFASLYAFKGFFFQQASYKKIFNISCTNSQFIFFPLNLNSIHCIWIIFRNLNSIQVACNDSQYFHLNEIWSFWNFGWSILDKWLFGTKIHIMTMTMIWTVYSNIPTLWKLSWPPCSMINSQQSPLQTLKDSHNSVHTHFWHSQTKQNLNNASRHA